MSNLTKRLLSAVVMIPPVLWAFVQGGWWLRGLAVVVGALSLWEYGSVVAQHQRRHVIAMVGIGLMALVVAMAADSATHGLLAIELGLVVLASVFVLAPGDVNTAWSRLSMLTFGVVYIVVGLFSVVRLRELGNSQPWPAQVCFVIVAMVATWCNDSGAYFAGRAFGKHKMAPLISPKKTWEGFAGGVVGAVAALFIARAIAPAVFAPATPLDLVLIGLPASFLGPMGDLTESLWKRSFDVKDSSNIIPGHGGVLDRIDAVLFVAPYVLLYVSVIKPLL